MTGAAFGLRLNTLENLHAEQDLGHVFLVIRSDIFISSDEMKRRIDEIFEALLASPPAAGRSRVLLPGEIEAQAEIKNRKLGLDLSEEVVRELVSLGQSAGVSFPLQVQE
jgi:LDH2 family malate/lactate/ureidoglycolate dehydrogenase